MKVCSKGVGRATKTGVLLDLLWVTVHDVSLYALRMCQR